MGKRFDDISAQEYDSMETAARVGRGEIPDDSDEECWEPDENTEWERSRDRHVDDQIDRIRDDRE